MKNRNPIAKASSRRLPDRRRKLLDRAEGEDPDSPLADLMPKNPLMAGAWAASLSYALSRDDVLAAFRKETGNRWRPGRTPIDQMIDTATGADLAFIRAFAKWHNENIWGEKKGRPIDLCEAP